VVAQLVHPPLEQRVVLDRDEAGLVCPVLEDPSRLQQARDRRLLVRPDTRDEREAVRAVDGRDRVELNDAEPRDLGGDVVGARAPEARRVTLMRDDVAAERRG
jgi:hypothetical protein